MSCGRSTRRPDPLNRHSRSALIAAMACAVAGLGCPTPVKVPLVYEYPPSGAGGAAPVPVTVRLEDGRVDRSADGFIAGGVLPALQTVWVRELRDQAAKPATGVSSDLQLNIHVLEATAGAPHGRSVDAAAASSVLVLGVLALPIWEHVDSTVAASVRFQVEVLAPGRATACGGPWSGSAELHVPSSDIDSPQARARALGAAVKQSFSQLPSLLSCVRESML
jgi:hypothetical protein